MKFCMIHFSGDYCGERSYIWREFEQEIGSGKGKRKGVRKEKGE